MLEIAADGLRDAQAMLVCKELSALRYLATPNAHPRWTVINSAAIICGSLKLELVEGFTCSS
jgi:hypothetical protein